MSAEGKKRAIRLAPPCKCPYFQPQTNPIDSFSNCGACGGGMIPGKVYSVGPGHKVAKIPHPPGYVRAAAAFLNNPLGPES